MNNFFSKNKIFTLDRKTRKYFYLFLLKVYLFVNLIRNKNKTRNVVFFYYQNLVSLFLFFFSKLLGYIKISNLAISELRSTAKGRNIDGYKIMSKNQSEDLLLSSNI